MTRNRRTSLSLSFASRGVTVMLVLAFMGVFSLLMGAITSYVLQQARYGRALLTREQAVHIAESGLEYYRWYLAHHPEVLDDGVGLETPYTYVVEDPQEGVIGEAVITATPHLECGALQWIDLTSVGTTENDPKYTRTLSARYMRPTVGEFSYIVNENVWAGASRNIKGPYHSNGGVVMDGTNNADVTSAAEEWWCDSDFSSTKCPSGSWKPGVWGDGPDSEFWRFPVSNIDFGSIAVDLSDLKTKARDHGGIYYGPASGNENRRGYHLVFQSDGSVSVYRVTSTTSTWGYSSQDDWQREYNIIRNETYLGNYEIPASCPVIFVEDRVWIEGTIKGKVTVAAATPDYSGTSPDAILRRNILYSSQTGDDGLTLIAERDVLIPLDSPLEMEIHGIFIAQSGRYGRNHYVKSGWHKVPWSYRSDRYIKPDKLTTIGSVVSNQRTGTSWTCGGSYCSGYEVREDFYDRALAFSPPAFTPAAYEDYRLVLWRE